MNESKTCIGCGRDLPADEDHFHRDPHLKGGLRGTCKECRRAAQRAREVAATPSGPPVHRVHTIAAIARPGAWHHTPLVADPEGPPPRLVRGLLPAPNWTLSAPPTPAAQRISLGRILALRRLHTRDGVSAEELAGRCGIDLARVRAILREGGS